MTRGEVAVEVACRPGPSRLALARGESYQSELEQLTSESVAPGRGPSGRTENVPLTRAEIDSIGNNPLQSTERLMRCWRTAALMFMVTNILTMVVLMSLARRACN